MNLGMTKRMNIYLDFHLKTLHEVNVQAFGVSNHASYNIYRLSTY